MFLISCLLTRRLLKIFRNRGGKKSVELSIPPSELYFERKYKAVSEDTPLIPLILSLLSPANTRKSEKKENDFLFSKKETR